MFKIIFTFELRYCRSCLFCANVSANRMQSDESWLSKAMLRCSLTSRCNVSANRMQSDESWLSKAMLRCSLTSRCNVSANRMQSDESWLSKAMPRCSLTSRCKDTTCTPPNPNFLALQIAPQSFPHPKSAFSPLSMGFHAHFPHTKKNEIGI